MFLKDLISGVFFHKPLWQALVVGVLMGRAARHL